MEIEILARKALEILKSKWGLPERGFLAGGSLANVIWELHSGKKAVVNDIDIFVFDGHIGKDENVSKEESLYSFREEDIRYYEDYTGMSWNRYTKEFYVITSAEKEGIFNEIKYKSSTDKSEIVLKSFDINCTRVGYSIEQDRFFWTPDFEEFLRTGELKICSLHTPAHTAIRIAKKSKELKAELKEFEFKLASYCILRHFSDTSKLRFKERYREMYAEFEDILKPYFEIRRDRDLEEYLLVNKGVETQLYSLGITGHFEPDTESSSLMRGIFDDANMLSMHTSKDFLFYARNVYGTNLAEIWSKVYYFYTDSEYVDAEVSSEDLDLLYRMSRYAPDSIESLKGMKISKQISLIKKLLEIYEEDPIIAISILEKGGSCLYVDLDDECTQLLLELSVRKQIVNDTKNKAFNILCSR